MLQRKPIYNIVALILAVVLVVELAILWNKYHPKQPNNPPTIWSISLRGTNVDAASAAGRPAVRSAGDASSVLMAHPYMTASSHPGKGDYKHGV
jgi:hypothetical protein